MTALCPLTLIELRPSRYYLALYISLHLGGMACWCSVGMPLWMTIGGCLLVLGWGLFVYLRHHSIAEITIDPQGQWHIACGQGGSGSGDLLGSSWMSAHLMVLHIRWNDTGRMRPLVLFSDMMPAVAWRRLRVWCAR